MRSADEGDLFCDFHGHSRKTNIFVYGCGGTTGTPERVRRTVGHHVHTCDHLVFVISSMHRRFSRFYSASRVIFSLRGLQLQSHAC